MNNVIVGSPAVYTEYSYHMNHCLYTWRSLSRALFENDRPIASFISATMLIPAIAALLAPRGEMVILVKPQFEAGRGAVGKGGIVRDPEIHREACERVQACAAALGFQTEIVDSPIRGTEGNREFLLHAHRKG